MCNNDVHCIVHFKSRLIIYWLKDTYCYYNYNLDFGILLNDVWIGLKDRIQKCNVSYTQYNKYNVCPWNKYFKKHASFALFVYFKFIITISPRLNIFFVCCFKIRCGKFIRLLEYFVQHINIIYLTKIFN